MGGWVIAWFNNALNFVQFYGLCKRVYRTGNGIILTVSPEQGEDNLKARRRQGEAYVKEC